MSICLALASLLAAAGLASCGGEDGKIKVGIICIGDENATYDKNFMNALDKVAAKKNIQVLYKTNVPEQSNAPYEKAVELAEAGCKLVISNSYGFEDKTILAAKEYPNVLFAHCTGDKAHTAKLDNYCNGFASIYEGRYLAGIAAGMKLKEIGETCSGYAGAFDYAEVISGFTAFYLGAKSVVENATMLVQYTSNWGQTDLESGAATNLLEKGALHNVFWFASLNYEESIDVAGNRVYDLFIKYKTGIHFGGNVANQRIFNFDYVPYMEQTKSQKMGVGMLPDVNGETVRKIIVPLVKY